MRLSKFEHSRVIDVPPGFYELIEQGRVRLNVESEVPIGNNNTSTKIDNLESVKFESESDPVFETECEKTKLRLHCPARAFIDRNVYNHIDRESAVGKSAFSRTASTLSDPRFLRQNY